VGVDVPELQVGAEIAGYRLEAVAGRGGMGVVYRARNLITDQLRALKVIAPALSADPRFRERFKRESRLAARLEHPNVIPLHEAREEDGRLYLVMRYVDGSDLASAIKHSGRLPLERALRVVSQVAAALDAAHGQGLVHRDVKPANVLLAQVDGREHAYLTDFGLVKDLNAESSLTTAGTFMGTYQYAAPEQIDPSGVEQIDGRADVYALGCVLYHALAGQVPFPRDSARALIAAHLFLDPPDICELRPELPAALSAVICRAMAKDRDERYSSAGGFAAAAHAAIETTAAPGLTQPHLRRGREATEPPGGFATEPPGGFPAEAHAAFDPTTAPSPPQPYVRPAGEATERAGPERARGATHGEERTATNDTVPPKRNGRRMSVLPIVGVVTLALVAVVAGTLLITGTGGDGGASTESGAGPPATAEDEVRRIVHKAGTSSDGAVVCGLGTQAFNERITGVRGPTAIEVCRRELRRLRRSGQISVQSIDVTGASATADVIFGDGEHGQYALLDTAEGWRLDDYVLKKRGSNTQQRR
jgi:hypothetical protein